MIAAWLQRHRRRLIIAALLAAAYAALVAMKPQWIAALPAAVLKFVHPFIYSDVSSCVDNLDLCREVGSPSGLVDFNMTPAAYWGSFVVFAAAGWLLLIVLRRVQRRRPAQRETDSFD